MASSDRKTEKTTIESLRTWVVDHKLRTVGTFWATALAGSFAWNFSQPGKLSVKIIHARIHAQALTLLALSGAAVVEYYEHKSGEKAKQYAEHVPVPAEKGI